LGVDKIQKNSAEDDAFSAGTNNKPLYETTMKLIWDQINY